MLVDKNNRDISSSKEPSESVFDLFGSGFTINDEEVGFSFSVPFSYSSQQEAGYGIFISNDCDQVRAFSYVNFGHLIYLLLFIYMNVLLGSLFIIFTINFIILYNHNIINMKKYYLLLISILAIYFSQ